MTMRLRICHTTRFSYEAPAYQSHNEIRMRPLDSAEQTCTEFALEIVPPAAALEFRDYFGNYVTAASLHEPHDSLTIIARSVIERVSETAPSGETMSFERFLRDDRQRTQNEYDFLSASPYVPFSDRTKKFFWLARPHDDEDVASYVHRLVAYVRDQFYYQPGVTKVSSTVDEVLTTGAGVCQDFAHLTIATLRLAGVPARYVSGYLAPPISTSDNVPGEPQATHAWIEAQLPYQGWVGFDPTHGCRADLRHIRVAIGRDYSDVAPIRGIYRSFGRRQTMSVDLRLEREADKYPGSDGSSHQQAQQ